MALFSGAFVLATSVLTMPTLAQEEDPTPGVRLILSNDGASYQAFERGFRQQLDRNSATMRVETTVAAPDTTDVDNSPSVILVAVGTSALESVLNNTDRPVVAAMVPSWIVARSQVRHPDRQITGIFIDQPAHRHVALVRALLPAAISMGLLSGMEANAERDYRQAADDKELFLLHEIAEDRSSLLRGVRQLARESDAIVVLPSPLTTEARNLRGLLLQSFRAGVPVIGFSPGLVEAGAIAAVFSDPERIGADTAKLLEDISDLHPRDWPTARYPESFQIAVNRQVARAIGLSIPSREELNTAIDRSRP